jgi:hypothetical protein
MAKLSDFFSSPGLGLAVNVSGAVRRAGPVPTPQ